MSVLIVGLGNPGKTYDHTRHSVGFLVLDSLASELKETWHDHQIAQALMIETNYSHQKVILAKPQTFMNLSGEAVAELARAFHIEAANIWIVSDDVALPLGSLRVRTGGSAGGHNGLKSIIDSLGQENFARFRIGVGGPPVDVPLENYVLQKFPKAEHELLTKVIKQTRDEILRCLTAGLIDTSLQA